MILTSSIVALERCQIVTGAGGKAVNLARLASFGHRIPRGVVVVDREYQRHLAASGVAKACKSMIERLTRLDSAALVRESAHIRARILGTPVSRALLSTLISKLDGVRWPVAVRSSASAEDSGSVSFAGQLDSVLGVRDPAELGSAIRMVWASAFSERCLRYAQRDVCGPGGVGVIVQEQVNARWSGVLFTRDPLARSDSAFAVLEYVNGLGDRLVSGEANPGRLHIRRSDGAILQTEGCDSREPLPETTASMVAQAGLRIEHELGGPQDIEWSVDTDGCIVFLQARPITGPVLTMWTNANIAENFPDPVTPFLYSIVARGYTAYFRNLGLGFGISRRRIEAMDGALQNLVGLHGGRLYYNLSNIHAALRQAPGGARLARSFNDFTGATGMPVTMIRETSSLRRAVEVVHIAGKTAWKYLQVSRGLTRFERRVDAFAGRTRLHDLAVRGECRLACDLEEFLDIRLRHWNDAALADAAAMVCYGLLKRVLPRDTRASESLQNDLLKGLPGLASAKPVSELWRLSQHVRRDSRLMSLLTTSSAEEVVALLGEPALAPFRGQFERYLDSWGFRYSRELMLTSPTPQEDPIAMIRILQVYLRRDGEGPDVIGARQAAERLAATKAARAALSPPRAALLFLVLRATQGAIRLRERARMKQALLYTRLRHVMLRVGNCLAGSGVLDNPADVFFLTIDEVQAHLANPKLPSAAKALIVARRVEFEADAKLQPPDVLMLPQGKRWQPGERASAAAQETAGRLHGISACGGVFAGLANVVHDVAEIDVIRDGEILVTRQTDPGWAAVFFLVKGLVVERGGMLSHGAIIAREYGIPAVVGVDGATWRIKSGERIRVDGDNGVVDLAPA